MEKAIETSPLVTKAPITRSKSKNLSNKLQYLPFTPISTSANTSTTDASQSVSGQFFYLFP